MGRKKTGATTTTNTLKIELSYLLKHQLLKRGTNTTFSLRWSGGQSVLVSAIFDEEQPYLDLSYVLKDANGQLITQSYKVHLEQLPSNLGKGYVLYFICPVGGKRCKILYMAYDSPIFKARNAYRQRIYYSCQIVSKNHYCLVRYATLKKQLDSIEQKKYHKRKYRGIVTKREVKKQNLKHKVNLLQHFKVMYAYYELKKIIPSLPPPPHFLLNNMAMFQ